MKTRSHADWSPSVTYFFYILHPEPELGQVPSTLALKFRFKCFASTIVLRT